MEDKILHNIRVWRDFFITFSKLNAFLIALTSEGITVCGLTPALPQVIPVKGGSY